MLIDAHVHFFVKKGCTHDPFFIYEEFEQAKLFKSVSFGSDISHPADVICNVEILDQPAGDESEGKHLQYYIPKGEDVSDYTDLLSDWLVAILA